MNSNSANKRKCILSELPALTTTATTTTRIQISKRWRWRRRQHNFSQLPQQPKQHKTKHQQQQQ